MNAFNPSIDRHTTPKDWLARWTISLTTPLTSLRMRNEIDNEMRLFAQRMPECHAVIMSGVLHDLLYTLDPEDPWMHLQKDRAGLIRLPGGAAFGTWESATDLAIATNADIARDLSLSPMANAITDTSAELIFHASHSWEEAQAFLVSNCIMENNRQHLFEAAEDAVRWALARRRAYAIEGDGFFPITAAAWANRATRVVASEPWDEARMLRLRHGAAVQEGSYFKLR